MIISVPHHLLRIFTKLIFSGQVNFDLQQLGAVLINLQNIFKNATFTLVISNLGRHSDMHALK